MMTNNQTFWQFVSSEAKYKVWLQWLVVAVLLSVALWLLNLNVFRLNLPEWIFGLAPLLLAGIGFHVVSYWQFRKKKSDEK